MQKTLIIASTTVDMILNTPSIPLSGEDVNISSVEYRIGGCGYNVFKAMLKQDCQAILCSPVGKGIYGGMVLKQFKAEGIEPFYLSDEENGCCFCLVEPDGERSFLSYHGAEYLFNDSCMEKIKYLDADNIYISGIDLEDPKGITGINLIKYIYDDDKFGLYFAPGNRINYIQEKRMDLILRRRDKNGLGPFLHLNEREALSFSGMKTVREAALFLSDRTCNSLVITLGEQGSYCLPVNSTLGEIIPPFPVKAVNSTGAGDTHFGSLIALIKKGYSLKDACYEANKIAAIFVSVQQ